MSEIKVGIISPGKRTTLSKAIKEICEEMNKSTIENIGVMDADGSLAYTLKRKADSKQ